MEGPDTGRVGQGERLLWEEEDKDQVGEKGGGGGFD